jgi:hypothetical protein
MDPLTEALRNVFGLLTNGIQLTIPLVVFVVIALFIFNFLKKKYGWKWIGSALAAMLIFFSLSFFLIHTVNLSQGFSSTDTSLVPPDIRNTPEFQADQPNVFFLLFSLLIQSLFSGVVFSILAMPFAFAGVAVFDALSPKVKGVWSRILITCFLASLVTIVLLGFFPWILVSLVYLAFFGI